MQGFLDEKPEEEKPASTGWSQKLGREPEVMSLFGTDAEKDDFAVLGETPAESAGETARRSGLAFSAGIAFFGSVVFMLIVGWFADLLFGSSPWGLVGGIVLGSVIGFVQFFRLTSQIFRK